MCNISLWNIYQVPEICWIPSAWLGTWSDITWNDSLEASLSSDTWHEESSYLAASQRPRRPEVDTRNCFLHVFLFQNFQSGETGCKRSFPRVDVVEITKTKIRRTFAPDSRRPRTLGSKEIASLVSARWEPGSVSTAWAASIFSAVSARLGTLTSWTRFQMAWLWELVP